MSLARGLTLRPLAPEDRAQWDGLWRAYLEFYQTVLPAAQYDLHFARLTATQGPWHALVAEHETGRLAGLAHCLMHPHGWHAADVCYLQDLYTAPDFRRCGVAAALIEAVYASADALEAADVYWTTQSFNDTARRVYDRVGKLTPFIKYVRG